CVPATAGYISTCAGTGIGGINGDGGPATLAELSNPDGVAVDGAGDLFIADLINNDVREVVAATGLIKTVAGDVTGGINQDGIPATEAAVFQPEGVAVDGAGDLFIADGHDQRVREVVAATGVITTVAGTGTFGYNGEGGLATGAELAFPEGVAVDGAGDLFIADTANNRVREVAAASGLITTVAGTGTGGFGGDGGLATGARLSDPVAVAVDGAGDLFIADYGNARVREVVAATGVITTVAGTGTAGYNGDGGPAVGAELNEPSGVAVDGAGDLFIADFGNQ